MQCLSKSPPFFLHPYKDSGSVCPQHTFPTVSPCSAFSFTLPGFFLFELLQQDMHQHLLFNWEGGESLKPWFIGYILTKGLNTKSGKATMVQHHVPTKSSTPIMLQRWLSCTDTETHTFIHSHTQTHTLTPRAFMVAISVQQHCDGHSNIFGATGNQHILSHCLNTCTNTYFKSKCFWLIMPDWLCGSAETKEDLSVRGSSLFDKHKILKTDVEVFHLWSQAHVEGGHSASYTTAWYHNVTPVTITTSLVSWHKCH